MKWFRSKCQDRHGQEAQHDLAACMPGSCLHPWVLPAATLAWAAPTCWLGTPHGFPSLAPFSSCHLCEQQVPCPVGRERISGKGAITLPLSSGGQPWRGAGRARRAQTTGPCPGPRAVCAWPKDPRRRLVLSHVRP